MLCFLRKCCSNSGLLHLLLVFAPQYLIPLFGAMLVFAPQYLIPLFGDGSLESVCNNFAKNLAEVKKLKCTLTLNVDQGVRITHLLMDWLEQPEKHGVAFIVNGFKEFNKKLKEKDIQCNSLFWGQTCIDYMFYVMAKLKYKQKEYRLSQTYFVSAVCRASSLFVRVTILGHLVNLCRRFGEYQLALKCLETR
eukprot:513804_1